MIPCDDEITRLRAALAEAERERDKERAAKLECDYGYLYRLDEINGLKARAARVEADLAAAREVMTAISTMPNRNGFELRHYDLLTEAIGSARAFLERTATAVSTP